MGDMISRLLAASFAALVLAAPAAATPHLFIDNGEISAQTGLVHQIGQPAKLGPIVDGASDHNFTPYVSVIQDGGRFRLWYDALLDGQRKLGYLESPDGVHFARPGRFLDFPAPASYGAAVVHTAAGYMLGWFGTPEPGEDAVYGGVRFAVSSDGLAGWRNLQPAPLFPVNQVGLAAAAGDVLTFTIFQGRYFAFVKMHGGGYHGMTANMPFDGYRRLVGVMQSSDGVTWSPPAQIIAPDARDDGITEFYGMGGIVNRGGLLVGFLRVLRDDVADGVGYTVLVWSRDGVTWQRDRQPFLDRSPMAGWDHAMAWADAQVVDGGRTLVYYGGYETGHKDDWQTGRRLGVATMIRDRYVARAGTGSLTTTGVRLGGRLTVNAAVRGSLRVDVVRAGRLVARCTVSGDGADLRPRCGRRLPQGIVRLRFRLRDVSLYGFDAGLTASG